MFRISLCRYRFRNVMTEIVRVACPRAHIAKLKLIPSPAKIWNRAQLINRVVSPRSCRLSVRLRTITTHWSLGETGGNGISCIVEYQTRIILLSVSL